MALLFGLATDTLLGASAGALLGYFTLSAVTLPILASIALIALLVAVPLCVPAPARRALAGVFPSGSYRFRESRASR